jgi:hypothetical protein
MVYVLIYSPPKGVERNPVLSRTGFCAWRELASRRRKSFLPPPVHQTQHPPPRTRVGGAAPPGGRRRASRRLYSVRTPLWVVGAGSGRVPGPKFAAGNAAGAAGGFLALPLDFVRWVVPPIKARGRYTLCSAIHRAEGVRRVRNGDF